MKDSFSEIELRRLDLNLLLVFAAIMREGGVGAAAKRLYLGPSAVSMALARLRDSLNDPLFVRSPSGMTPTPRAVRLWADIEPALVSIGAATRPESFDPSTLRADFRLGAPDDLEFALVPRLMARLARDAPELRLVVQPMDFRNMFDRLDDGSVDLGLSALPSRGREQRHLIRNLKRETFEVLYDPAQMGVSGTLTLKQFTATPQVIVSISGDPHGPIDDALANLGQERRIVATVARFATIPFILRSRPILACVPATSARLFARAFGLRACALPFVSPSFDLSLTWHRRTDRDPAHLWFRTVVENEVRDLVGTKQPQV